MNLNNIKNCDSGSAITLFALILPVLVGVMLLVIDGGKLVNADDRLQNTADSIALGAAKWIVRIKQDPDKSDVSLPEDFSASSWLPTESELRNYAKSNFLKNFENDQDYAELLKEEFRIASRYIPDSPNAEVHVVLCAIIEANFQFSRDKANKTCAESKALIEPIGLKDLEVAISIEASVNMTGAFANDMRDAFTNKQMGEKKGFQPILDQWFVNQKYMDQNNILFSIVPFNAHANIYPYRNIIDKPFTSNILTGDALKLRPEYLLSNYPMITNDKFSQIFESNGKIDEFDSAYNTFRYEKDAQGKRGYIYEDNPRLELPLTYAYAEHEGEFESAYYMVPVADRKYYKGSLDHWAAQVRPLINNSATRIVRGAYTDIVEGNFIQPLSSDYNLLRQYFTNYMNTTERGTGVITQYKICRGLGDNRTNDNIHPKLQNLLNRTPKFWPNLEDESEQPPESIKSKYKNRHLDCALNVNAVDPDEYARNWNGLIWAYLTLSPRTQGWWSSPSYLEDLNGGSIKSQRGNTVPTSTSSSKRKKIILHLASSLGDAHITASNRGIADSFTNLTLNATDNRQQLIQLDSIAEQDDFTRMTFTPSLSYNKNTHPSYEKICKKLKDDGIDLYILVVGATDSRENVRPLFFNQLRSCVSDPEKFLGRVKPNAKGISSAVNGVLTKVAGGYNVRLVE